MSGSIVCGLRSQHTVAGILLFSEATTAIVDGTLLRLTVLSAAVMVRCLFPFELSQNFFVGSMDLDTLDDKSFDIPRETGLYSNSM